MTLKENFLRELRIKHGIKLTELARRVGITTQTLTGFEKKRHGVSDQVLLKIANILNVNPEEIVPGKSLKNTKEGQRYLLKAIKITDQYYAKRNFKEDAMIEIATELYHFLVAFDRQDTKNDLLGIKKDLKRKIYQGLAAKCFLNSLKS